MINSEDLFKKHICDNSTVLFNIGLEYLGIQTNIKVTHYNFVTLAETLLTLGVDYTVDTDNDTITTTSTYPGDGVAGTSDTLTITYAVPSTQKTDITANSNYDPEVLEEAYDHGVLLSKQVKEIAGRGVSLAISDTGTEMELPPLSSGLDKYLYVNSLGEIKYKIGSAGSPAAGIDIADAGGYYIGDDVEVALQEAKVLDTIVANTKRPGIDNSIIPHFIGQAYTNLVQDPTDLRAAGSNWTAQNSTDAISTLSINDNLFTKIINSGANAGFNYQTFTPTFSNSVLTGSVICKKGSISGNLALITITDVIGGIARYNHTLDFDNYPSAPANPSTGTLLDYNWIDSETLQIFFKCAALAAVTDDIRIALYASPTAIAAEYTYWTEVQLIDEAEITMFPFVEGIHVIDIINETFTLPDQCTIVWRGKPRFAYDNTEGNKYLWSWRIDATHYIELDYRIASNKIFFVWYDGGTARTIVSYEFDDGSSFTDINQEMIIVLSFDGSSGSQTGSRLIIIPLSSGAVNEDNTFSGTPDIKSSTFPTMAQGHFNSAAQADSEVSLIQIFSGLLVGAVTSSIDLEQLLQQKSMTYEAIPDAFAPREIPVDTPISSVLQQITNEMRTGQGIQDGAILDRHLNTNNLNTVHRASDGKNHADVVLNNTHRASDGSDHTFIDQDVKIAATPTFAHITSNGNAVFGAKRITSANFIYDSTASFNDIFDKLAPFIPINADVMLLNGAAGASIVTHAIRTDGTTITIYFMLLSGSLGSLAIIDGAVTTTTIAISW